MDLAPTLLELAGSSFEGQGKSFLSCLKDHLEIHENILLETGAFKSVVNKKWKYIENHSSGSQKKFIYDNQMIFPHFNDPIQLYHLESDISEQVNLADRPETDSMQRKLKVELNKYYSTFN